MAENSRIVSASVGASVVLVLCAFTLAAQDDTLGWRCSGRVEALSLASVKRVAGGSGPSSTLTFRNDSQKAIAAFAISGSVRLDVELFELEHLLLPGETQDVVVVPTMNNGNTSPSIDVSAVLFEDGTYVGSKSQAAGITYQRLGRLVETERVRRILEAASGGNLDDSVVASLRSEVGDPALSVEEAYADADTTGVRVGPLRTLRSASRALSDSFLLGASNVRDEARQALDQMKQIPVQAPPGRARTRVNYLAHLQQRHRDIEVRQSQRAWHVTGGEDK